MEVLTYTEKKKIILIPLRTKAPANPDVPNMIFL